MAAQYCASPGKGIRAARDEMLMIAPRPAAIILVDTPYQPHRSQEHHFERLLNLILAQIEEVRVAQNRRAIHQRIHLPMSFEYCGGECIGGRPIGQVKDGNLDIAAFTPYSLLQLLQFQLNFKKVAITVAPWRDIIRQTLCPQPLPAPLTTTV